MQATCLIFPGQGAQFVGMGKEFYETSKEARAIFDAADEVIPGLTDVIFNGPAEKLTSTQYCQPAILTFSVAALKAFQAHAAFAEVDVRYACGLSLGEYGAIVAAGGLDFVSAFKLVQQRSSLMEEAVAKNPGAMAAVLGMAPEVLMPICQETGAEVANFNSPDQIVITGEPAKVAAACEKLKSAGAKRVIPLEVAGAFHSSLMADAVPPFADVLAQTDFADPTFPVISNVDGQPATTAQDLREKLTTQITSSVQWVQSMNTVTAAGVTHFIEIGPGNVLKGLLRKIDRTLTVKNISLPEHL